MLVNVLGTPYEIIIKKYYEDEIFERKSIDGYCDGYQKKIVVCDMRTYKGWENEEEKTIFLAQMHTIRHEIVHAFLNESGLMDCACTIDGAWAHNEELVDWIAVQGEKIHRAWMDAESACYGRKSNE